MQRALSGLYRTLVTHELSFWPAALEAQALVAGRRPLSYIPEPDDTPLYEQQLAAPNKVRQVSVLQLDNLVRQASLPRLIDSARFLHSQLPARLENHVSRLRTLLPSCRSPELAALIRGSADSKAGVLDCAHDWGLLRVDDTPGLHHFESHLAGFRERVEGEMGRLMAGAQQLAEGRGWWAREGDVRALNKVLDLTHWYVLGLRLMLTQHSAALAALDHGAAAAAPPPGGAAVHLPQLIGPPPAGDAPPPSIVAAQASPRRLLAAVAEDVRALAAAKSGAAPDISVSGGDVQLPLVVPYFAFLASEVLKNAAQATLDRYGAWSVDEAEPVRVDVSEPDDDTVLITVTDRGLGVPSEHFTHMFDWFWSSSGKPLLGYGYSQQHVAQMHGLGAGVPVSRVIAHFLGGSAHWETSPYELHTTVEIRLPKQGFAF